MKSVAFAIRAAFWGEFAAAAISAKDPTFATKADYAMEEMERRFPELREQASSPAACSVPCEGCPVAAAQADAAATTQAPPSFCWNCQKPVASPTAVCDACGQHNPEPTPDEEVAPSEPAAVVASA